MALADYFDRGAVAAAQVIAGFDERAFKEALSSTTVGLALSREAAATDEGRFLADLVVRLLARLYPSLTIDAAPDATAHGESLVELARVINPRIEIASGAHARIGIVIGAADADFDTTIFAGSDGWLAHVGTAATQPIGSSGNPFGAGAAACLACANVFRCLFLGGAEELDAEVTYSAYAGDVVEATTEHPGLEGQLPPETVLVGCGAIGNGAAWALARAPLSGQLHLVDPEMIELSNLQRYALAERSHVDEVKVDVVAQTFTDRLKAVPHRAAWADFVAECGYAWRHAVVALDSARDRRAVQGSLPEWVVNAWTQPGDLGVSTHGRFSASGSCLSCLYLPSTLAKNEDELVAEALGVPDQQQPIRHLLYSGEPPPSDLLDLIAERLTVPRDALLGFQDRSIRELYVEGLCGGAVLPLSQLGSPQQDVHVPLAHQSALAGIQLAASFLRQLHEASDEPSEITRINVLRPLGTDLRQAARKSDSRCICADADYTDRYVEKWLKPRSRRRQPKAASRAGAR